MTNDLERRLRLRRALAAVAAASAVAVALAACSGSNPTATATAGAPTGTLTLVAATPPTSLNPAIANADSVGSWYNQLSYDPLIRLKPDGSFEPDLATSWKFLDDKSKEFELTIRTDAKFDDGTAITAKAVADTLNYYVANASNGKAWLGGADTKAEATDAKTVVVHLGASNSNLPGYLTQRTLLGSVINPKALNDPESLKTKTFGAGPYVLDTAQTVTNSKYVYTPNKNYWNKSTVHYAKVVIQVSGSNPASFQAIQSGDADMMRGDLSTATSAKAGGINVVHAPTSLFGVAYVDRAGVVVPELKDVRVRQALSYAIDRTAITKAAWGEEGQAGNALTLPDYVGFTKKLSNSYSYDPTKAKELLKEAGYADGFSFTIGAWNLAPADKATQAIVEDWKKIGVNATIQFYSDASQLSNDALAKKFGVITYYYGAGRTSQMTNDFLSGASSQYNPFGTSDATITSALNEANATPDEKLQQSAYSTALTTAIVDQAWLSNVAYSPSFIITSDKVTGLEFGSSLSAPDIAWRVQPKK